jgi:aspartate/methionine/tyrosine aminotransferase
MATAVYVPAIEVPQSVSPTLATGTDLEARRGRGERVLPMGFGEAGLPVHRSLRAALAEAAASNRYGPVAGHPALRAAAAAYWNRRGLFTDPDMVVCGPGSKALLFGLLLGMEGDIAIARPSWVSYAAQAALTGRVPVRVAARDGLPDPAALDAEVTERARSGRRVAAVIATLPDNPTGTLASAQVVQDLCEVAERHDLLVISDEIYRDLVFERPFVSPSSLVPWRTVVTTGLSKSLALGGWRLGVARLPSAAVRDRLLAIGSEIWSSPSAPVQRAATLAFAEGPEITDRIARSRRLHAHVVRAVAQRLAKAGAQVPEPAGAFYVYPDFSPFRELLMDKYAVDTSAGLAALLLRRFGIGVLEGSAFGDPASRLRLRMATSRLYGDTEAEQEAALAADDPCALDWIADSLNWLEDSLTELVS